MIIKKYSNNIVSSCQHCMHIAIITRNKGGNNLNIEVKEVLRYLGYKNQSLNDETMKLVDECIREVHEYIKENYVYGFYDINKVSGEVQLVNTNVILQGKDIYNHLKNSKRCAIMAVTAGSVMDFKIRYYEKVNLTKALILDACATTAVESVCDEVEEQIKKEALNMGFGITWRYSPGYGDLPINLQPKLLNLLEAQKKIGLTASESYILLPRKSVTAIIGFQSLDIDRKKSGCDICSNFQYCQFRKEGNYCGA